MRVTVNHVRIGSWIITQTTLFQGRVSIYVGLASGAISKTWLCVIRRYCHGNPT